MNCNSLIKESIGAFPNILWIYPGVNLLSVIRPVHWEDLKTALLGVWNINSKCSSPKFANDIVRVPVIINQRITTITILVPNHSRWIMGWILIVVISAWDDKAGAQQCFHIAWHLNMPSPGTVANVSCKRTKMQKVNYLKKQNNRSIFICYKQKMNSTKLQYLGYRSSGDNG